MAGYHSEAGEYERQSAADLLPVVSDELHRLAVPLSGQLPSGQPLQPSPLVYEAYLHLVGFQNPGWQGRRHFFGAAAVQEISSSTHLGEVALGEVG